MTSYLNHDKFSFDKRFYMEILFTQLHEAVIKRIDRTI